MIDAFNCSCTIGYAQELCDYNLDECYSDPCNVAASQEKLGGRNVVLNECSNDAQVEDEYVCDCSLLFYTGDHCLIDTDESWFSIDIESDQEPWEVVNLIKAQLAFYLQELNATGNITITDEQYNDYSEISAIDTCLNGCTTTTQRFQFWEEVTENVNTTAYTIAVQTGEITDEVLIVFNSDSFKEELGITADMTTIEVYQPGSWIPIFVLVFGIFFCFVAVFCFWMCKNM
jgi:hypothetical protein